MNRYKYIYILLAVILFGSCADHLEIQQARDMEIVLKSYVPTSTLMVKSAGFDSDSQVTGGLDLSMWRWDEGASTDLSTYSLLNAVLGGNPDPSDGWKREIHFNPAQYYKDRTSKVGFMGYYPDSQDDNWVKTDGKLLTKDSKGRPMMTYNIDGETDVLFSDFKKGDFTNGIGHLTFSHALCRYRVYVYAVDDDAKEQWGDLTDVTFMNLPEQLFISLPSDFTDASQKTEFSFSPAPANQNGYKPTHILTGQQISLPVGATSKMLIGTYLGGAPAIGVLGISIETEKFSGASSPSPVSIARDYKSGYTYNIMLRLSTHGVINVDVVAEDWADGGEHDVLEMSQYYLDLSRYGTSNSYIVSSSNMSYCFDATVKGNGVNKLERYDGEVFTLPDKDVSLQTVGVRILSSDSKLIWDESIQDYRTPKDDHERHGEMIRLLADQVIEGKILFDVPGELDENGLPKENEHRLLRRGNARIGGFDAAGNLIWSWHIWVTDRPRNLTYGNGYVSMDRNLGAVSTDPEDFNADVPVLSGCAYQWGRKDPFFFHELMNHPEYIKEAPVPISDAHKYPRSFFKRDHASYETGGYDWTSETNDHLWGWISDRDNVVKTLYDPCPPGYRVNGNALWEFQNPEQDAPVEVDFDGSSDAFEGTNIGYYFGIKNYAQIYYPATMFVHHDGKIIKNKDPHEEDNGKAYVYRYSATPYVSNNENEKGLSYHFRYNINQTKGNYLIWDPHAGGGRVQAFPVRCVYEDSRHEITDLSGEQTSNCYIVDHARYFKFNAVTPGNAVGALNVQFYNGDIRNVTFDGGVDKNLSVEKVDVLWWQGDLTKGSNYLTEASKNNLTQEQMQNLCPIVLLDEGRLDKNGDVNFKVPQDKLQNANIILAGYDVSGVIQWTWHIWMVPGGVNVVRFGNYTLLDRNIGATYAPVSPSEVNTDNVLATHGFFYQWGRKDPFVGRREYGQSNGNSNSSPWFYKSYNGQWEKITSLQKGGRSALNIIETIKNPTKLYSAGSSAARWQDLYECDSNNDGPINHMWGYTGVNGAWGDTFAKTMWDPCPPGYKVLNHETLQAGGLWDANNPGSYRLYYRPNNGGAARVDYGMWLIGNTATNDNSGMYTSTGNNSSNKRSEIVCDGLWLPNTWRINESGNYAQYTNTYSGYMHTACPFSGYRTRTFKWYQDTSNNNKNNFGYTSHDNDVKMPVGTTIRCLKE